MGGPLSELRVVELAGIGPVPFAGLLLAELGADVIRVDRPEGSGLASVPAQGLHRSRPNVAVDLKNPAGQDALLDLVERADVLVEGLRPGVTERLGIGPEACLARNPRLIYGRMTGWGQTGPLAPRAGHDITYAALTGALHVVGTRDKPLPPVNIAADFGGGSLYLLVGILAALHARTTTGRGQVVDAAMVDGSASLITMIYGLLGEGNWADERQANLLDGGAPFYDTYRCRDGRHVAVGALEPQFYAALLAGLGVRFDTDQMDRSQWPHYRAVFATTFATRTREEWEEIFDGTDACVAPVLSLTEAPHHPHLRAREVFARLDGHDVPRVAPRFSLTPGLEPTAAHTTGQDTVAALLAWGIPRARVESLLAAGAIVQKD
jgi:alpha-methylacyl-CoA racemase